MAKTEIEKTLELADQQTLDRVLSTAPRMLTEADLDDLVVSLRNQRSRFIAADAKKAAKKEGVEDDDDDGDGLAE